MKRTAILSALVLVAMLFSFSATAEQTTTADSSTNELSLRLLTANIWGDYFGNPVSMRDLQFAEAFEQYQPDVIGMQEVTANWHTSRLFESLSENYVIVDEFEGVDNNYVPLAYRKDRFELLESGFQYYTQTPDDSKAFTYAVLKSTENGQVFAAVNTHFWWKSGAEHDEIRMVNAQELVACMQMLEENYQCPVFAFGDLNCSAYASPFQYFAENGIVRLRDVAQSFSKKSSHHGNPQRGDDDLYHGKMPTQPEVKSLDHIIGMTEGYSCDVLTYQLILDQPVLDSSDHSPVYADIILSSSN